MGNLSGLLPRPAAGELFLSFLLWLCPLSTQGFYALTAEEMGTLGSGLTRLDTPSKSLRARLLKLLRELTDSREEAARLREELRNSQEGSEKLAQELAALEKSSRRQEELLANAEASYEKYAQEQRRKLRQSKFTLLVTLLFAGALAAS